MGEGLQLVCSRPTLALSSALALQTLSCPAYYFSVKDSLLINALFLETEIKIKYKKTKHEDSQK